VRVRKRSSAEDVEGSCSSCEVEFEEVSAGGRGLIALGEKGKEVVERV
jgi:hypothetical protein